MSDERQSLTLEALRRGLITEDQAKSKLGYGPAYPPGGKRASVGEEARPAEASEPVGIWDQLKNYFEGSKEGLQQAGKGAMEMAKDVGQSLMPTREGAQAGGRVAGGALNVAQGVGEGMPVGMSIPPRRPTPTQLGIPGAQPGRMQAPVPEVRPNVPMMQDRNLIVNSDKTGPVEGLVPANAKLGDPSPIGAALVANDAPAMSKATARIYRRAFNPKRGGGGEGGGTAQQNMQYQTAADTILDAVNNGELRFKDAEGNMLKEGQKPRTVDQFMQGIDHMEGTIAKQYTNLAKGAAVKIPMQPFVDKLLNIAVSPEVTGVASRKGLQDWAMAQGAIWEKEKAYNPEEFMNVLRNFRADIKRGYTGTSGSVAPKEQAMMEVAANMRQALNQTMEQALGGNPQFANLRNQYGSLASIKQDVANALQKQENAKNPGLYQKVSNPVTWLMATYGLMTRDWHAIAGAGSKVAMDMIYKWRNSPNAAVTSLFNARARERIPQLPVTGSALNRAGDTLSEIRSDRAEANRRGDIEEYKRLAKKYFDAQQNYRQLGGGS
jgi:hypothetical protein